MWSCLLSSSRRVKLWLPLGCSILVNVTLCSYKLYSVIEKDVYAVLRVFTWGVGWGSHQHSVVQSSSKGEGPASNTHLLKLSRLSIINLSITGAYPLLQHLLPFHKTLHGFSSFEEGSYHSYNGVEPGSFLMVVKGHQDRWWMFTLFFPASFCRDESWCVKAGFLGGTEGRTMQCPCIWSRRQ